ncbi:MAG: 3-deoxy-8-phosphooctulonate synthase [Myxococcota bacterium]|nr:3-deoxy-8-phosphooctulonate synthase [Myxococcota bacterium]
MHRVLAEARPFFVIAGPCLVESAEHCVDVASTLRGIGERVGVPVVFKASFDKANRTSLDAERGPGLERGADWLQEVRERLDLPILTDVHEPGQAKIVAEVADCLQIPAFLARQTDLVAACAATGRALNVKKAQYMAPDDLLCAVEKAQSFGAENVLVTERGSMFGYNDLVVDLRGFAAMRRIAPLCFDATHAAQHPGAGGASSTGNRDVVAPLARAAVAVGVDALFVEVHQDPGCAPCDGQCQIRIEDLDRLLGEVCAIGEALA